MIRLLAYALLIGLLISASGRAQTVTVHPADQPATAKAGESGPAQWQRGPDDVSKQFLANIQARIGLLEASEMEARALQTVTETENSKLHTALVNEQQHSRELQDRIDKLTPPLPAAAAPAPDGEKQ